MSRYIRNQIDKTIFITKSVKKLTRSLSRIVLLLLFFHVDYRHESTFIIVQTLNIKTVRFSHFYLNLPKTTTKIGCELKNLI